MSGSGRLALTLYFPASTNTPPTNPQSSLRSPSLSQGETGPFPQATVPSGHRNNPAIPAPRHQCPPLPSPQTGTGLHLSCQLTERGRDSAGPPVASQLGRSKAGPWLEVCGSRGAPPITQVAPQMKEKTSLWCHRSLGMKPADLPRTRSCQPEPCHLSGSLLHWPRPVIPKGRSVGTGCFLASRNPM